MLGEEPCGVAVAVFGEELGEPCAGEGGRGSAMRLETVRLAVRLSTVGVEVLEVSMAFANWGAVSCLDGRRSTVSVRAIAGLFLSSSVGTLEILRSELRVSCTIIL